MSDTIRVQNDDFDLRDELDALRRGGTEIGAVASFVGLMRDLNEGDDVSAMTLEHYPEMTEKALGAIVAEAHERWPIIGLTVIHRVGELLPGDQIVLVAVASRHRQAAFDACEFIMDYLKTRAPFWKKERTVDGHSRWVDARSSDNDAASRWRDDATR